MNLYLLSQGTNSGYDTYDSCVVAAETPEDAVTITPNATEFKDMKRPYWSWCFDVQDVQCSLIGAAVEGTERGAVIASFKAG